jgi:hypothetical protein
VLVGVYTLTISADNIWSTPALNCCLVRHNVRACSLVINGLLRSRRDGKMILDAMVSSLDLFVGPAIARVIAVAVVVRWQSFHLKAIAEK